MDWVEDQKLAATPPTLDWEETGKSVPEIDRVKEVKDLISGESDV